MVKTYIKLDDWFQKPCHLKEINKECIKRYNDGDNIIMKES